MNSAVLILLLPVLGSLIQAIFGGSVIRSMGAAQGKRVMGILAVLPIAIAFGLGVSILMSPDFGQGPTIHHVADWITLFHLQIPFEVVVDPLSITMTLIITGIGSLIHLYATGYMGAEREYTRFFTYLNLFVAFMLMLVLGGNLALLFVGWEVVGLCSYLLIGFWYKDLNNAMAANKAFIVNRIGDWGLSLGIFLLIAYAMGQTTLGSETRLLSYDVVLKFVTHMPPTLITAAALLLFVGAMGKSAQFPLYLWLPDAMAGPTPVSALIHAATMVTSGVVLLNRMAPLFSQSPVAGAVICMVGAFTALFAALIAFGQTDIKKVLAYSTVSQLGFMFIGCGVGAYWTGMFHVTTHAFFKALLFLGSGAVIYSMAHDQDMRNYGKLAKYLPITFLTMSIGWLAISGVPPLSGFFSKESILGSAVEGHFAVVDGINYGVIAGEVGIFAALLTAFYMTRMTLLTFMGGQELWRMAEAHGDHGHDDHHADHAHDHADHGPDEHGFFYTDEEMAALASHAEHEHHESLGADFKPIESPISMTLPLIILAILSVGGGYLMAKDDVFAKFLGYHLEHPAEEPKLGPLSVQYWSLIAAGLGILSGFMIYYKRLPRREGWDMSLWSPFRKAARNQFGYDAAMVSAAVEGGDEIAKTTWRLIDVGVIDGIVNGAAGLASMLGRVLRKTQTGYVRTYALWMLVGAVGIVAYLLLAGGGI